MISIPVHCASRNELEKVFQTEPPMVSGCSR